MNPRRWGPSTPFDAGSVAFLPVRALRRGIPEIKVRRATEGSARVHTPAWYGMQWTVAVLSMFLSEWGRDRRLVDKLH